MQDVHPATRPPRQFDDLGDREVLGAARPRRQEVGVVVAPGRGRTVDCVRVFGVHDHHRAERCDFFQGQFESLRIERWKLVHARVQQEALEAEHSRVVQPTQVRNIARHRTTPESDVDIRLVGRHPPLHRQCLDVDGRRDAVEWHVDDRGHTAGRGRACRGGEPFPLGSSRLVDVHMGVDQTRDQDLVVTEFDHLFGVQFGVDGLDDDDSTVPHPNTAGHLAGRRDHPRRAKQQVQLVRHRTRHPYRQPHKPLRRPPVQPLRRTRSARCRWS